MVFLIFTIDIASPSLFLHFVGWSTSWCQWGAHPRRHPNASHWENSTFHAVLQVYGWISISIISLCIEIKLLIASFQLPRDCGNGCSSFLSPGSDQVLGICSAGQYQEATPEYYIISSIPPLFAAMYGDWGYGICLLPRALLCHIIYEETWEQGDQMWFGLWLVLHHTCCCKCCQNVPLCSRC